MYSVIASVPSADGNGMQVRVVLHADHAIYQAHFPGQPITPGVCLLQMARELMEDCCAERLCINSVKNAKFLAVVSPIDTPQLVIDIKRCGCGAQFVVGWGDKTFAKMSMDFVSDEH